MRSSLPRRGIPISRSSVLLLLLISDVLQAAIPRSNMNKGYRSEFEIISIHNKGAQLMPFKLLLSEFVRNAIFYLSTALVLKDISVMITEKLHSSSA